MADFETILSRLQTSEGLDRGAAITRLRELNDAGYVPKGKIEGLDEGLFNEGYVKAPLEHLGAGVVQGVTDPAMRAGRFLYEHAPETVQRITNPEFPQDPFKTRMGQATPLPGERLLKHVQEQAEPFYGMEGAGEIAGSVAGMGVPWAEVEVGVDAAASMAETEGLIGKATYPWLQRGIQRGIAGGIYGAVDPKLGPVAGAAGGAFIPPVLGLAGKLVGKVGGIIGEKLESIFTRPGADTPVDAEFEHVEIGRAH